MPAVIRSQAMSASIYDCFERADQFVGIQPLTLPQGHDVELHAALEEPPIIRPPLHHQRKTSQLRRPPVDVEPEQVLLQDQPRDVAQAVAALQVDRLEQVVGLHVDVPGAAGRVHEGQFLGVEGAGREGG
jgi:hypothetical protein